MTAPSFSLLRPSRGADAHKVSYVELFFDLVFVFAITQVSHILIGAPGFAGLVQTLILSFVIWWVWIDTAWVTNWLDPERGLVRGLLIILALLGLLMSSAIPNAFTTEAFLFAVPLVTIQLGRSLFAAAAFSRQHPRHALNFVRIAIWLSFSGTLWIMGAMLPDARLWLWLIALAIDYAAPRARFWVPGLGSSALRTWNVAGEHLAERVSLFIIIALGESIVVAGSRFSELPPTVPLVIAFVGAFTGTVLMWLVYFNHSQRAGSDYLSHATRAERGQIAQIAFTYVPVVIVIGIVLTAVADADVLIDPLGAATSSAGTDAWVAALTCGGYATYVLGNALFRRAVGGGWLTLQLIAVIALVGLFFLNPLLTPITLSWLINAILTVAVIADEVRFRRTRRAIDIIR